MLRAAWEAYEAMLGGFRHYGPGCDLYEAVVAADQVLPVMSAATMGALDTALAKACGEVDARRAEYVAEGNPLGVRAESKRRAKILAALALTARSLVDLEVAS